MPVARNNNENIRNEWFCVVLQISLPVFQKGPFPFVFFLNVIYWFVPFGLVKLLEICQTRSLIPGEHNSVPRAQKRL